MIELSDVNIRAGKFHLERVSFQVESGAYAVLMGRTGSGKTTILEAVCGLRTVLAGSIRLDGRDITDLAVWERGVGYVPQDRALFSTMNVWEHLAFGPTIRKWPDPQVTARVLELAGALGIGHLLARGVRGLSGGEAQRVALGRALAPHPRVLLLDEPLSALDEETRNELCHLLKSIQARTRVTILHVTHSPAEAARLADVVLVLENGRVQRRTPEVARDEG